MPAHALTLDPRATDVPAWQVVVVHLDPHTRHRAITALVDLLKPLTRQVTVQPARGPTRVDPTPHDLAALLRSALRSIRLRLEGLTGDLELVDLDAPDRLTLTLPGGPDTGPARLVWLQSDSGATTALRVSRGGLTLDALHTLVGFIARLMPLDHATLAGSISGTWRPSPTPTATPIHPIAGGSLWLAAPEEPDTAAELWFEPGPPMPPPPTASWLATLDTMLGADSAALELSSLSSHLRLAAPSAPAFALSSLVVAPQSASVHSDSQILILEPAADSLLIRLDLTAARSTLRAALLHLVGHLRCAHVLPGDPRPHVDTVTSITTEHPHRRWDREARLAIADLQPPPRRVTSLADCTPHEKAQLGLWRMIGEMLGESRQIHPEAERYQRAAYQRQAAQRIVSMLEDYGGAMLCDGVGLGKTYVATTVIVHYANRWRDEHRAHPERLHEDPFRITILAPRAVVSTWVREALPSLADFGVPLPTIRVLSHTQLSSLKASSEILASDHGHLSDLEHLLLSDLVIVDEAHNFRSLNAKRTKVLRDLLRLQPRKSKSRRVALLTATPINNSLEDLRQELSLLFSRPLHLSDERSDPGYRKKAIATLQDRCAKARKNKSRADLAAFVVHGQLDARFSDAIEFRDNLNFGPRVPHIGDYLKEQDKLLQETRDRIRLAAQNGAALPSRASTRIAEALLDRVVVQRSRHLCKEIERAHSADDDLLFRPDAGPPEKLRYADDYDGTHDVLKGFLPLFDTLATSPNARPPLSLKVYMWYDVEQGLKSPSESSSVVGLQRMLVLKRLESSPVAFLITLVRLTVLYAHRLNGLLTLCSAASDARRKKQLEGAIAAILGQHSDEALEKLRTLSTGKRTRELREGFLAALSAAYTGSAAAADTDDPPPQLELLADTPETAPARVFLDRLWPLHESILQDFATLLSVTPDLAEIIFGRFAHDQWPKKLMSGGTEIDWPTSPEWGLRIVTDAKLRQLVSRLLKSRREHQKVVVFSQFTDTIAYAQSVLAATRSFARDEWRQVLPALGSPGLRSEELGDLIRRTAAITGDTDNRDELISTFAPFYRLGPTPPPSHGLASLALRESWEQGWRRAIEAPVDVLIATDVLAEGVNLQDAALLINYDVHWNPVRMIQRAGRVDRRLNPKIEHAREFPELAVLAARLGKPTPTYYWHAHPHEPPVTVNMILPDELEDALLLRERLASKTLAIDVTLGLEQGTGAEADWMERYKFQGIASLNALQKDRAIELLGSHHERLARRFVERRIAPDWSRLVSGWFRERGGDDATPLIARVVLTGSARSTAVYNRCLEPRVLDGVPHWLWSQAKPGPSLLNFWLALDRESFPAPSRTDLAWTERASVPVSAEHLLSVATSLDTSDLDEVPSDEHMLPLVQGVTALSAGFFREEHERAEIEIEEHFVLQLRDIFAEASPTPRPTSMEHAA